MSTGLREETYDVVITAGGFASDAINPLEFEDKCHTEHRQQCHDEYDDQCTTKYNQECHDEYEDKCHTEIKQVRLLLLCSV